MEAELALLDSFRGKRVLVVGDECEDIDIEVEPRSNPEGEWPCWREIGRESRAGMAGAVGEMVRAMGAVVTCKTELRMKVHRLWHAGNCVARFDSSLVCGTGWPMLRETLSAIACADAIILSDYGKGTLTDCNTREIIVAAKAANVPLLVDPARGVPWSRYAGATIIKANRDEAAYMPKLCAGKIVVTKGKHGMTLHHNPMFSQHFATEPRDGDCTGCGDVVAAVLGLTLASRGDIATGCRLANIVAGLKLAKRGAQPVSVEEVRAVLAACVSH